MSHEHKKNSDLPPPEYQDRDISLKALWWFFIVTFISVGLTFIILRVLQNDLNVRIMDSEKPLPAFAEGRQLPPADKPLLQSQPPRSLAVHRAHENELINGAVTWADAGKTKARIPVTNAMEIILAKPGAFPARTK